MEYINGENIIENTISGAKQQEKDLEKKEHMAANRSA